MLEGQDADRSLSPVTLVQLLVRTEPRLDPGISRSRRDTGELSDAFVMTSGD